MAFANLPKDQRGESIQALAPSTNVAGTIGAASARVALPASCDVVRVACAADCYVAFGNSAVTASSADALFLKGVEVFRIPTAASHLAFIQVSAAGAITVTAMV
jgi:hypothetical protein